MRDESSKILRSILCDFSYQVSGRRAPGCHSAARHPSPYILPDVIDAVVEAAWSQKDFSLAEHERRVAQQLERISSKKGTVEQLLIIRLRDYDSAFLSQYLNSNDERRHWSKRSSFYRTESCLSVYRSCYPLRIALTLKRWKCAPSLIANEKRRLRTVQIWKSSRNYFLIA